MKISPKSKRFSTPHPQIAELITKLLETPNDALYDLLSQIDSWKWPRSDLHAWIKVLNKFDAIMEGIIRDYEIDKLQVHDLPDPSKKLLCEILRFERLLLENSTNRKIFNSYDRLKALFMTSDLDVLILTLNLLLRPAQQYSAQPSVSHALNISTPRLQSLAKKYPSLRDYSVGLLDLTTTKGRTSVDALPSEAREVHFSFYKTGETSSSKNDSKMDTDDALAASQKTTSSGAIQIHIDENTLASRQPMELVFELVEAHSIPEDEKLELLTKIRVARALVSGNEADREKLVTIRLLALAIFGHTHTEAQATSTLFLYEPDLVVHIAELLQIDQGISIQVQTAAIAALDALVRYRGKTQEVFTALNAGVNHGSLMALLRKTVNDVGDDFSTLPHSFVDALLSFVSFVATNAAGGNMVVGAGLIPLLIQLMENKIPLRLPVVSKTMQLIDNVVYNFTNAFQVFCSSRGVEVLVGRIEYEIDFDITHFGDEQRSQEVFGSFGELPVPRAAVLKHALRSMHRMMQSAGTAEGLRGLIDSTLPQSIKKIIRYRGLFGASVIPLAINIMATFVHNEPTSLSIVQEAGLPEVFYKAIESGLEPAIEVIQAFANAIGALCLNQVGQDQLATRPSIIPSIFAIFTSDRHLKVLFDKENAVLVGATIDELIRHHPLLKAAVFDSLKATLSKIADLGVNFEIPKDQRHGYTLVISQDEPANSMEGVEDLPSSNAPATSSVETMDSTNDAAATEDSSPKAHDNQIVSYIDVICRFLEGLFQYPAHCKDFVAAGGLKYLAVLTGLPCLPYDFANSVASDSLIQIMRTMTEASTSESVVYLSQLVQESLNATRSFWGNMDNQSKLLPFVELSADQEDYANQEFRNLVTLHIRITLLSDVFSTAGYAHGRAATGLLSTLMGDPASRMVPDLGSLHRASIWENVLLKDGLNQKGIEIGPSTAVSPIGGSPNPAFLPLPPDDNTPLAPVETQAPPPTVEGGQDDPTTSAMDTSPITSQQKEGTPRYRNAEAIKHLTHGIPTALTPFFQAIVKMFHTRRNPDASQKKQIISSSAVLADVMLKHITPQDIDNKLFAFIYYSVMLGVTTVLIIDDRTSAHTLHTVQLLAFHRAGGLDAVWKICRTFIDCIQEITAIKVDDRTEIQKQLLIHAFGGIKVALHLIHPIISSKPIFESGQTLLVTTRDKSDNDPDYFEPHNFLTEARLAVTPLLQDIWQATWLLEAPLGVIRSAIQVVLEATSGENEESSNDSEGALPSSGYLRTTTGPDEGRIQQLTDMGFPRSAVERALLRSHNNVNTATELLLSSPFPLPPDPPAAEVSENVAQDADQDGSEADRDTPVEEADRSMDAAESTSREAGEGDESSSTTSPLKATRMSSSQLREALTAAREPLRASIARRALLLVDEHVSLIFDIHYTFVKPTNAFHLAAVQLLVDDIREFSPSAFDIYEQPLANRCRLLALVLAETPSSVGLELRDTLLGTLIGLLLSDRIEEQEVLPKWLASQLLLVEALLALFKEPVSITTPKEGEPVVSQEVTPVKPKSVESPEGIVFDLCMRLLAVPSLPNDEILAVLRLLVLLTRDYQFATRFVMQHGVVKLFERLCTEPVGDSSSYVATILRHTVEDTQTVKYIMHHTIKQFLSMSRARPVDPAAFVRSCGALALRDSSAFIQVSKSLCQLNQAYSSSQSITLKDSIKGSGKSTNSGTNPVNGPTTMHVDVVQPPSATPSDSLESVIHFLVAELMKSSKSGHEPGPDTTPSKSSSHVQDPSPVEGPAAIAATAADTNTDALRTSHQYSIFIMQCLTELLFSYDSCKSAFLSYSPKKRLHTPAKDHHKHRTAALSYLLELITYGTINPQPSPENKINISTCNWAMSVIVALCVDSSSGLDTKDVPQELVSIRKFVLEAVSRTIKDPAHTDHLDAKYGRLVALGDLCHRLLTVQFNTTPRKPEDAPTHVAKIMLEKNFVSTLTTALSEVDLNYPNVRSLVAAILRPLEHLTKVAIKMSRASNKTKDISDSTVEGAYSISSEEDDESEDGEREETPDLYRNSALGMYGGEMEDVHFEDDGEEDDDEEDDDEDVEMDFGQETGSEDTSISDDEEVEEDIDAEDVVTEEWDDQEEDDQEVEAEDLVENEQEDEDDDDGEDDESVAEDGVEVWQGMVRPGDDGENGREDGEEEPNEVDFTTIPIMRENEGDEREGMSDDEDYNEINDLAIMENADHTAQLVQDIFGFGFPDQQRQGGPIFVPRRHRGMAEDSAQLFGRRNALSAEATTHPLLLDSVSNGARPPSNTIRGSRSSHRDAPDAHIIHAFEDLMGGGALRFFQHIASRGRGQSATFRIDVPAGGLFQTDRGGILHQRPPFLSAHVQVERNNRHDNGQTQSLNFDPMLTLQRWAEENKILHGDFVNERVAKLANHVVLALLPEAIDAAKRAKIKEQAELEEKQRREAVAATVTEELAKSQEASDSKNNTAAEIAELRSSDAVSKIPSQELENVTIPPAQDEATNESEVEMAPAADGQNQEESEGDASPDNDVIMSDPPTAASGDGETTNETTETATAVVDSAAPSTPPRVTVMIHGALVDITDTGIDPTFLEALPDDMREEVLNQHVRDQRAARVERPPDSQISSEFLDALPPELRAEIIQQERIEQARQRTEAAMNQAAPEGIPADMDPASFIASLDPHLRQVVLLDSDDGFIQTLPSHLLAETGMFRDGVTQIRRRGVASAGRTDGIASRFNSSKPNNSHTKAAPSHDAIQLLDKSGIAVLVRLLFYPQVLKKNLLFKVLVNICENAKTRTDLLNLILNILQEGSGDLAGVDKSFAQMSFRTSKGQSSKAAGKQKASPDFMNALTAPNLQSEAVPDLIAQRCLEGLNYIVSSNELASLFFLTEHELPAGLRRAASRKGKGKEKQAPQTHFPIVLLLGLLDRQYLLKTPSIMESVVGLLATITRPLTGVGAKEAKKLENAAPESVSTSALNPVNTASASTPSQEQVAQTTSGNDDNLPTVPLTGTQTAGNDSPEQQKDQDLSGAVTELKTPLENPPQIPHHVLRLIVNILTTGECSGRTFQQSLALIQHLSFIADARDVIAQELLSKAQDFGHSLHCDLDELVSALQASHHDAVTSSITSKFSPASSVQAKLLRVLKTIDYMYSPKPSSSAETTNSLDSEKVQNIYESFHFTPLWRRLGDCLSAIEDNPEVEHIATVLLPLIEALMVVCKYVGSASHTASIKRVVSSPRSPMTPRESMEDLFVSFTDAHRKILNLMVRNNPSLMSGSFSLLVNNPRVLDFDNKRNYFNQQLHRRPHSRDHHGTLQLNVRRARLFEDSFQHLQRKTGDQIKYGKLSVRFYDEEGVDAGGVTREWFQILARQMFDPNNALFQPCAADRLTYQPNKNSWINSEHLSFFKFVGRVIGKAIYDSRLLDAYFARSLYRQILGKPVDYRDVEWVDPEYYNSLCWILENDPTLLDLTFSVEADEFGVNRIIPLKENGEAIAVTQENKREFVQLSAQFRLYSSIKDQIESLLGGFYEIIPKDLVTIFNEQELELLISGTPDIDVDEWRAAAEYHGYNSSDPVIVWFWRALKSFNRDERAKVLSFTTGTSKVPLGGFVDLQGVQGVQRFSIHRAYGEEDRLPQAHTCFNQIDLPQYSSYENLRRYLLLAINEGGEGFGFA